MDDDPFYQVKAEVETALATLSSLSASYSRLADSSPDSQDARWTLSELKANLATIHPDLVELEESVQAVEERGIARRLGIDSQEVKRRRDFVERIKREVSSIRRQLPISSSRSPSPELYRTRLSQTVPTERTDPLAAPPPTAGAKRDPSLSNREEDEPDDANAEFEMQQQSLLLEQQDRTLTDISGTVGMLREQAKVIGQEVFEQTGMLDELDHQVDSTSSRLARAQRKMDRFLKDNSSSPSSWFILGLIVILCILLFIILFT
ncbi:hypothetical protein JCM10212_001608 [Sporobolomyces blumeae]